jgi:hypothetical protein
LSVEIEELFFLFPSVEKAETFTHDTQVQKALSIRTFPVNSYTLSIEKTRFLFSIFPQDMVKISLFIFPYQFIYHHNSQTQSATYNS